MAAYSKCIKKYTRIVLIFVLAVAIRPLSGMSAPVDSLAEHGPRTKAKPHIVFLISEDSLNYEAHKTVPVFAQMLKERNAYQVTVLMGEGKNNSFHYPGLEVLAKADLMILFSRRVALSPAQMQIIKDYLNKGKPLVGMRTANHAFSIRGELVPGYIGWHEFVADILGCENRGYGPVELGTDVSVAPGAEGHPILKNVTPIPYHSGSNVYKVAPLLDSRAKVLLMGKAGNEVQPIAWTRMAGKSRVFYTSMGYPTDFDDNQFKTLIINAINWALQ